MSFFLTKREWFTTYIMRDLYLDKDLTTYIMRDLYLDGITDQGMLSIGKDKKVVVDNKPIDELKARLDECEKRIKELEAKIDK